MKVSPELIKLLAEMAELQLEAESEIDLASMIEENIQLLRKFPLLGLPDANSGITFDPRWDRLNDESIRY